jgi:hypothetical protein
MTPATKANAGEILRPAENRGAGLRLTMLVASSAIAGLFLNDGEFAGEDGVGGELDGEFREQCAR